MGRDHKKRAKRKRAIARAKRLKERARKAK
jgi:hypothetical protein